VATRPSRPVLRERYDRRRAETIERAAGVFARRGVDQTSMQGLADELGVAVGGLYHYFPGKERLIAAICDELMHPLLEDAAALGRDDPPADEHLRALVRLWVENVVARRDHMLVFQQERHVIESGEEWRATRSDRKRFERLVDGVLAGVEAQGAAAFADRRLALAALLGMVNHTAQWYRPGGRLTPARIAAGYVDLLLR
jgi:AcrR family transcriptional regulator